MTTGQKVLIGGGVAIVAYYLFIRKPGDRDLLGLGGLFPTVMPNSPTQQQRAMMFAAGSGGSPDYAGTAGRGATSIQPAYAGLLPGLGTAVSSLFQKLAGPGNAAPSTRPQASASSGGGVSQPTPGVGGWTDVFDQSHVFFGQFDDSYGDFGDVNAYGSNYAPATAYLGQETITSDQGTYDVMTGEWY